MEVTTTTDMTLETKLTGGQFSTVNDALIGIDSDIRHSLHMNKPLTYPKPWCTT